MNVLKKVLLALAVIFILIFIALFIVIKTVDVDRLIKQNLGQVSQSIGRNISVSKAALNLSLQEGLILTIRDLAIEDDPAFLKGNFFEVKRVYCSLNLKDLVIQRQIVISAIRINAPHVTIVRNAEGDLNVQKFASAAANAQPSAPPKDNSSNSAGTALVLSNLVVGSVELDNGNFLLIDRSFNPELRLSISDVKLGFFNISLDKAFKFTLSAAVVSEKSNLNAQGVIRLDLAGKSVRMDDVQIRTELAPIKLEALRSISGLQEQIDFNYGLRGALNLLIGQAIVGEKGLLALSVEGQLSDFSLKPVLLAMPLERGNAKFTASELTFILERFEIQLAGGKIAGDARINDYLKTQSFKSTLKVQDIQLAKAIDQSRQPVQIEGKLKAEAALEGKGFSPEALNNVAGQLTMQLTNGKLINFNILNTILKNVQVSVEPNLLDEPANQDVLNKDYTILKVVNVEGQLKDSVLNLSKAEIDADQFKINGSGTADLNQNVSLNASLSVSPALSADIVKKMSVLRNLLDEQKGITIPVRITGRIPNLHYMPDVEYLTQRLIVNQGREQLQKVLQNNPEANSILGPLFGGTQPSPEENSEDSSPDENGDVIDSFFNAIFK